MSNLFWYNFLAIIGIGIATFSIYKKKHLTELSTWIVFYLFATSITWLGEFTVLGFFNSYAYKPGVFSDPWAENLLGHLILNSTLWPGMAILVVSYSLDYKWIILISAVNVLIEYLFVQFGMYEQHWWKYYMTAVTVALFLTIAQKWFSIINRERHGISRFITLYLVAVVIIHISFPLLLLLDKQYYSVHLTENLYRSSIIFILSYHLIETFIIVVFSYLDTWYWKAVPFVISSLGQTFLASRGILIFKDEWNLFYTIFTYAISITVIILVEKHTLKPRINKKLK